jgi:hypothetical protein
VPDAPLSPADLMALFERFRLRPQDVPTVAFATRTQLDLMLARITALTDLVRSSDPVADDASRLAIRLLLVDLGVLSAWLRGEANEKAAALGRVLDEVRQRPNGRS